MTSVPGIPMPDGPQRTPSVLRRAASGLLSVILLLATCVAIVLVLVPVAGTP